jgi:hypothetical protein
MPLINIATEQDAIDIINGVAQAVQNNQVSIGRMSEALDRVMTLKTWIAAHNP